VLHAWSQKLKIHPHVHCVVPAGGLSLDHTRWIRSRDNYFLPKEVLRDFSWQVRGCSQAGLPRRPAPLPGRPETTTNRNRCLYRSTSS
jgi:hypothetical protein